MFIAMQDYLKVKQISTCSLKCEVPYYTIFKERTGNCINIATKCFIYFSKCITFSVCSCTGIPRSSGDIINPEILPSLFVWKKKRNSNLVKLLASLGGGIKRDNYAL